MQWMDCQDSSKVFVRSNVFTLEPVLLHSFNETGLCIHETFRFMSDDNVECFP